MAAANEGIILGIWLKIASFLAGKMGGLALSWVSC